MSVSFLEAVATADVDGVTVEVLRACRHRRPYEVLVAGSPLNKLDASGKPSKWPRQFQHVDTALEAGKVSARLRAVLLKRSGS